jgi:hypothetical protein
MGSSDRRKVTDANLACRSWVGAQKKKSLTTSVDNLGPSTFQPSTFFFGYPCLVRGYVRPRPHLPDELYLLDFGFCGALESGLVLRSLCGTYVRGYTLGLLNDGLT